MQKRCTSLRAIRGFAPLAALCALLSSAANPTVPPPSREYELKAQMMRKMLPYVAWPKGTFTGKGKVIAIGVVGKDPFGKLLDKAFAQARIKGIGVKLVRFGSWQALKDKKRALACHALFIARSEDKSLANIVTSLRGRSILLFSDSRGFARRGTHINFFVAKSKVGFETHAKAARKVGIQLSAKLIRLGRRVE